MLCILQNSFTVEFPSRIMTHNEQSFLCNISAPLLCRHGIHPVQNDDQIPISSSSLRDCISSHDYFHKCLWSPCKNILWFKADPLQGGSYMTKRRHQEQSWPRWHQSSTPITSSFLVHLTHPIIIITGIRSLREVKGFNNNFNHTSSKMSPSCHHSKKGNPRVLAKSNVLTTVPTNEQMGQLDPWKVWKNQCTNRRRRA
jgi:hypothetical protein